MNVCSILHRFFCIFLILPALAFSQENADEIKVYTSIKEAMENPLEVKAFRLTGKAERIPPEIFQMRNLRILDLSKAKINFIPAEIAEMDQLEELILKKTMLRTFPEEVLSLSNLRILDISFTEIIFLPEDIEKLWSLEELNLRGTDIDVLPASMSLMESLKIIDMRLIDMNKSDQDDTREKIPHADIFFSSPCNCK